MAVSGAPCRSWRMAQAYMVAGTWPSGGISPISYKSLPPARAASGAAWAGAEPVVGMASLMLGRAPGATAQLEVRPQYFAPQQKSTQILLRMRKGRGWRRLVNREFIINWIVPASLPRVKPDSSHSP